MITWTALGFAASVALAGGLTGVWIEGHSDAIRASDEADLAGDRVRLGANGDRITGLTAQSRR